MSYITIEQFRLRTFEAQSVPHPNTIIRWIRSGKLAGRQLGGRWYVDSVAFAAGGDPLLEKILRHEPATP